MLLKWTCLLIQIEAILLFQSEVLKAAPSNVLLHDPGILYSWVYIVKNSFGIHSVFRHFGVFLLLYRYVISISFVNLISIYEFINMT